MGCDIHMCVELNDWGWVPEKDTEERRWQLVIAEAASYGERNYGLFGILAGVRDSRLPLLVEPRGMPDDASLAACAESARLGRDGHTHSWITLKEVLDFDWSQPTPYTDAKTCGEVAEEFLAWARSLVAGATRLARRDPANIRFVFWFDN